MTTWLTPVVALSVSDKDLTTYFASGAHLDGVQLATSDRFALVGQTDATENGIYVMPPSGTPSRATDANTGVELVGSGFLVQKGMNRHDTFWICTNLGPPIAAPTIGADDITFTEVTSPSPRHSHEEQHRGLVPADQLGGVEALDGFDQGALGFLRNFGDGTAFWSGAPTLAGVLDSGDTAAFQRIRELGAPLAPDDAARLEDIALEVGDLLTGDSQTFLGGIGDWTNSGGTLTDDTGSSWPDAGGHSAKLVTTTGGDELELQLSGTFLAGTSYAVRVVLMVEEAVTSGWGLIFGNSPTDYEGVPIALIADHADSYFAVVARWTPSTDETDPFIVVNRQVGAGTITLHIGHADVRKVLPMDDLGFLVSAVPHLFAGTLATPGRSGFGVVAYPGGVLEAAGGTFTLGSNGFYVTSLTGRVRLTAQTGQEVELTEGNSDMSLLSHPTYFAAYNGLAATGDLVSSWEWDLGPDYVGLQMGEKDAGTLQMMVTPWNDIELADRPSDGTLWRHNGDPLTSFARLYRLAFAWNTASISTGVPIVTLATGDVILGAWLDVSTAWNSTVSDAGDIVTATNGESLMNATVNMQSVGAGTDRRKLKDGALLSAESSLMLGGMAINVKVASTGISLSAGAATAFVLVSRA